MRNLKRQEGASTVEFALIAPILIMLIFAIFEFGLAFNSYLAITHAAREGARLAAVGKYDEAAVRERAYPVIPTAVSISYPDGNLHGQPVEVRIEYDFPLSIPFFGRRLLPLTSAAEMRLEV
ncbi:MAG: pilus assembly protein [Actinomycetota bacterium]|nr:pilus assembly protein [Actinomycetota bacterium]